uniref:SHSP domain-containing protein n=1 Tax=Mycena chlorophos TaxID=658473 RepID=A0ABQ0KZL1_MYCCL|nr:predicted protein [Mycena chlorophos]
MSTSSYYEFANTSQPQTPRDYAQWDQQQQESQHSDAGQLSQASSQQQLVTPTQLHPTLPAHLEEQSQRPQQQQQQQQQQPLGGFDMAPVRLQHPSGRSPPVEIKPVMLQVDTSVRQTATATGAARTVVRAHQHNYHPYAQRPSSAAARRDDHVRFQVGTTSQGSTPGSGSATAMQSPAPNLRPAFTTSPLTEFHESQFAQQQQASFVAHSPQNGTGLPQDGTVMAFAQPSAVAAPEGKPYGIRADTYYDPRSHVLTMLLELPGIKKQDVRISLTTNPYDRLRHLVIRGHSYPPLPPVHPDMSGLLRERRYGVCKRRFTVPVDTRVRPSFRVQSFSPAPFLCGMPIVFFFLLQQPADIDATMEDGVLVLKIQCGFPAPSADQHEIPIR